MSENTQAGKIPHMNVMLKGKTDKFFKYVQFLSKFVGCNIFEKALNSSQTMQTPHKPIRLDIDVKPEELKGRVTIKLNGKEYKTNQLALKVLVSTGSSSPLLTGTTTRLQKQPMMPLPL